MNGFVRSAQGFVCECLGCLGLFRAWRFDFRICGVWLHTFTTFAMGTLISSCEAASISETANLNPKPCIP